MPATLTRPLPTTEKCLAMLRGAFERGLAHLDDPNASPVTIAEAARQTCCLALVELGEIILDLQGLTPNEGELLKSILRFQGANGYSPTMQELADERGVSKVTVFESIGNLERKHWIRRDKHKARSIEVAPRVIPSVAASRLKLSELPRACKWPV